LASATDLDVLLSLQPEEDETIWTIPLTITSLDSTKETERIMMSTRELTIAKPGGLYFVNLETVGTCEFALSVRIFALLAF